MAFHTATFRGMTKILIFRQPHEYKILYFVQNDIRLNSEILQLRLFHYYKFLYCILFIGFEYQMVCPIRKPFAVQGDNIIPD
jgi:hypothetical protein